MTLNLDKELKIARRAARYAGRIMMRHYGRVKKVSFKHDKSRVTEVDTICEKKILSMLKRNFPEHSIYSEEEGMTDRHSDLIWVIDPLDGTTNYSMMFPFFNVSIGLMHKGKPVLGVVYFPIHDELFYAAEGRGAYMKGKRLNVSDKKDIKKSIIGYCFGHGTKSTKRAIKYYSKLRPLCTVRQFGSAALELAYVACGRIDAFQMNNMNSYDVAAGAVLVKEAGGKVTDFGKNEFTSDSVDILASNGRLHDRILEEIGESKGKR